MKKVVNTSVINGNIKVYYDYLKPDILKQLNPMGNFYRHTHLHKETQRFMENYLQSGEIPLIGDIIISDKLFSQLVITNIIYNYKRTEGEIWIKRLEDEIKNNFNRK
tara:strand:- start:587 stop:907 length:321 start_codon:yes stop_codon:yes gene_type:complete